MKKLTMFVVLQALTVAMGSAQAATITRVYGFTTGTGYAPNAPLIQASDGNFYGTTSTGGDDGAGCGGACVGTVFKLTPQGQLTVLYTFAYGSAAAPYANGRTPLGGLVEGPDGYLYGTTNQGGVPFSSYGVIYKISKTGQFQKIHDFCPSSPCPDAANPEGSLVFGRDGKLYGTSTSPIQMPRIFRISTSGTYEVLANLYNTSLGTPQKGLTLASDGNLYGLARFGVYRLNPGGGVTTLYLFATQPNDGIDGNGPLIQGVDGNLYGATHGGGTGGAGTVFRISLSGTYQKIFDIVGATEGVFANAVIQTSNGNLWGTTTNNSGAGGGGAVYSITTGGALIEATFLTNTTGRSPQAPLIQANDGRLYGTASTAGPDFGGTVYVVDAGLAPPAPGAAGPPSSPMLVTSYDKATGAIGVSYGLACYAPDHHIVFGPLAGVATYAYTGQACLLGKSGAATFNPGAGDYFWVIVGNTTTLEGSYGRASNGTERPPAPSLAGCPYTQDLSTACP